MMAKNNTNATMVKINFYIVVCFMLLGCSRHNYYNNSVLVKNNRLKYVNYTEPEEYSFSFFNYPASKISDLNFDAVKQNNKIPITGNDSLLVAKIIENFEYLINKEIYDKRELEYIIDTITPKELFFCGKITVLNDFIQEYLQEYIEEIYEINSFLILRDKYTPSIYYPNDPDATNISSDLYLLNFKNNKLTSMVRLSISGITNINFTNRKSLDIAYLTDSLNMSFTQIDYRPYEYLTVEVFIPPDISDYVKVKKGASVLYFSSFWISEFNGFVELNWE